MLTVVCACVFERTRSIFASAVAHGIGNALAFTDWSLTL
jgi:membrane protease YdiL (CAAX protease family)